MVMTAENAPPFPDKDGDGIITYADIPTDPKEWMTTRTLRMLADEFGDRDGKITKGEWASFWKQFAGKPAITATSIGAPNEKTPQRSTRWSYGKGIAGVATPLLYRGVVYYINMGGILTALDAKTGDMLKVGRLEGAVDDYYASPVAADGRLYVTSETGKIVVVKAGADWSILACNDLDEPCYATPALSNGKIFVRTSKSLACFGTHA
jgi:outer membrane protein assembly factor BamB